MEDLGMDGRIVLEWILKKNTVMNFQVPWKVGNFLTN
jgi:hypothetical protein